MTSIAVNAKSEGTTTIRVLRTKKKSRRALYTAIASILVVLVAWELLGRFVLNPLFFPPLSAIYERFLELVSTGVRGVTLGEDLVASSQSYLAGLVIAIVVGGSVGIAMAASRTIRDILDPWVAVLNATPTIALAPIFILVFGLGITSKIAVCALVMVFPILINTYTGFTNTDASLVETARSFGATPRQVYLKVKLPMAVPYLVAAFRLAAAHGLVGVVASELFGAKAGLGMLIMTSAQTFDSRALFVGIIILGAAGTAITYIVLAIERRLTRWRRSEKEE